jgi:hypothetical protein
MCFIEQAQILRNDRDPRPFPLSGEERDIAKIHIGTGG